MPSKHGDLGALIGARKLYDEREAVYREVSESEALFCRLFWTYLPAWQRARRTR